MVAKIPAVAGDCTVALMASPMPEADARELAGGFAALADPVRLRLMSLLATASDGEVCACDLVVPLGRSQPTVSHHLKVLTDAGLVIGERRGRWIWYSIVDERVESLRNSLNKA